MIVLEANMIVLEAIATYISWNQGILVYLSYLVSRFVEQLSDFPFTAPFAVDWPKTRTILV